KIESKTELLPTDELSDDIKGTPPKKTIHIIVELPTTPTPPTTDSPKADITTVTLDSLRDQAESCDADGRQDEFVCVRQGHGYGVGLSKNHCNANEEDSRFFIIPTGHGTYKLASSEYGELKADSPWITPHGSGAVEFELRPY
ncbi:hypothetical protein BGZ91_004806, partial [Linnemannia elongata]